jgi:hypothetical protein
MTCVKGMAGSAAGRPPLAVPAVLAAGVPLCPPRGRAEPADLTRTGPSPARRACGWPLLGLMLCLLLGVACTGERGPAGVQGPPGEGLNGATRVARFDAPEDVDTWLFGTAGEWQVADGRLVLEAAPSTRMAAGPSMEFSHDVDISVAIAGVTVTDDTRCGFRFHASPAGAYQFGVDRHGLCLLQWEDGEHRMGDLLTSTVEDRLPAELRVLRRGAQVKAYVDGGLVGTVTDAALSAGRIELFVEGQGRVAFDDLWVGTALALE